MRFNRLIQNELTEHERAGRFFKPVPFSKSFVRELIETHSEYGLAEYHYCCYGMEQSCWTELIEDGVWGLTLDDVKREILNLANKSSSYLYGNKRFYLSEGEECLYLYVFLRDKLGKDFLIWFDKTDKVMENAFNDGDNRSHRKRRNREILKARQ